MTKIAKLLTSALLAVVLMTGFAMALSTGDVAFTAFNADGNDDFAIVALADIPANTTLYFTDNEPSADGSGNLDNNEGTLKWVSGGSIISAGTIIVFTDSDGSSNPSFGASVGTLSYEETQVNLAGGGDALYCVEGNPTTGSVTAWLAGIQNETGNEGANFAQTGLTKGSTFIEFYTSGSPDGGYYSGSRDTEASFSGYLSLLGSNTNWTTQVSDGELILPISTTAFSTAAGGGVDNPSGLAASVISSSQINLTWTENASGDEVMVVYDTDNTFDDPEDGTTYSGSALGGTVIYQGVDEAYNHTSLSANTQYYYKAWSVDGDNNYSSGLTANETTLKAEPASHVTDFATDSKNSTSVTLTWTDSGADGYVVTSNGNVPVDGTTESDGAGQDVVSGATTAIVGGLDAETAYTFKIYPYNNSGTDIDYKTDGVVPSVTETTDAAAVVPDLYISEVADPKDLYQDRFVELYNASASAIDLAAGTWTLAIQSNGGGYTNISLTGTVAAGETYVIANNQTQFETTYNPLTADQYSGSVNGNGNDAYSLYMGGTQATGTMVDIYGVPDIDGSGQTWEYLDGHAVRKQTINSPNTTWTASEWNITLDVNAADMEPGVRFDAASPITLAAFTAKAKAGVVELAWETASETNNAQFVIYRNNEVLATVEGAGTTSETNNYVYTDASVVPGVAYTYVLADVDYDNDLTKHENKAVTVTLANDVVEADFVIGAAYPNPFNPTAIVPVELSRDAVVEAKLYTITGREIATLANGTMNAGSHELRISANNMTTGLYLVKIAVENVVDVQKIAFVK